MTQTSPGTLYICATPIGNLADWTFRAVEVLRGVSLIYAEDTRHSQTLLQHYQIQVPVASLHEHNEKKRVEEVLSRLQAGEDLALISDAGTPGIADPGQRLVEHVARAGYTTVPLPGASALTTALSASGLPADQFLFLGFLPRKPGDRRRLLQELLAFPCTGVAYEVPHRIGDALADICGVLGRDRPLVLARELTKRFETFYRGTAGVLQKQLGEQPPKGEWVILIGRAGEAEGELPAPRLVEQVEAILQSGTGLSVALKAVAQANGVAKNTVYRAWLSRHGDTG